MSGSLKQGRPRADSGSTQTGGRLSPEVLHPGLVCHGLRPSAGASHNRLRTALSRCSAVRPRQQANAGTLSLQRGRGEIGYASSGGGGGGGSKLHPASEKRRFERSTAVERPVVAVGGTFWWAGPKRSPRKVATQRATHRRIPKTISQHGNGEGSTATSFVPAQRRWGS